MPRPREDELTWIFGSSRSGSTWLERMLAEHPEVRVLDETGIGHHLGVWRPIPLAWATAEDGPPPLTTFAEVKRGNEDYLFGDRFRAETDRLLRDFLLERIGLQHEDGRRTVVKEPGGSQVADWIMRLMPGSGLVFLLRDGRDVVDSWLDASQPGGWHLADGGYAVAPEGRLAFLRWQAAVWLFRTEAVQRAYAAHDPDRRVLVRYEDLLADPGAELARVQRVVGVRPEHEFVGAAVQRHAYSALGEAERGRGRFVRAASPGGWRENLTAEEQAALHEVLGAKLRELGYAD